MRDRERERERERGRANIYREYMRDTWGIPELRDTCGYI
jgi:hypothetical protein